jgi:hypothetical protein
MAWRWRRWLAWRRLAWRRRLARRILRRSPVLECWILSLERWLALVGRRLEPVVGVSDSSALPVSVLRGVLRSRLWVWTGLRVRILTWTIPIQFKSRSPSSRLCRGARRTGGTRDLHGNGWGNSPGNSLGAEGHGWNGYYRRHGRRLTLRADLLRYDIPL